MLLNLSNHPSSVWPVEQQSAARKQFGAVQDLDFPYINPAATSDEVALLAEQYVNKIRAIDPLAVHLMGELTFCFQLANLLKAIGYEVVASTTHRTVAYTPDGQKVSNFQFVQFRPY